jgi:hypothetical protein
MDAVALGAIAVTSVLGIIALVAIAAWRMANTARLRTAQTVDAYLGEAGPGAGIQDTTDWRLTPSDPATLQLESDQSGQVETQPALSRTTTSNEEMDALGIRATPPDAEPLFTPPAETQHLAPAEQEIDAVAETANEALNADVPIESKSGKAPPAGELKDRPILHEEQEPHGNDAEAMLEPQNAKLPAAAADNEPIFLPEAPQLAPAAIVTEPAVKAATTRGKRTQGA